MRHPQSSIDVILLVILLREYHLRIFASHVKREDPLSLVYLSEEIVSLVDCDRRSDLLTVICGHCVIGPLNESRQADPSESRFLFLSANVLQVKKVRVSHLAGKLGMKLLLLMNTLSDLVELLLEHRYPLL